MITLFVNIEEWEKHKSLQQCHCNEAISTQPLHRSHCNNAIATKLFQRSHYIEAIATMPLQRSYFNAAITSKSLYQSYCKVTSFFPIFIYPLFASCDNSNNRVLFGRFLTYSCNKNNDNCFSSQYR